jgi:DNA-binding transcriptional LysR family regulator
LILRHLRYFAAAADEGSLAGAARRLRVAQPALSRQVRALEHAVGTPLFIREARGVCLTAAGSALLAGARVAMDRLALALHRTRLAHRGEIGTLRLGLGRWALHLREIGRALAIARERYPHVDLAIVEAATLEHSRMLLEKTLDIAIGLQDDDANQAIAAVPLHEDPIDSAALPSSHPLAARASVGVDDLRGLPLIGIDRESGKATLAQLFRALRRAGFEEWEEHSTIESVYSQVAAGRGWSHAPRSFRLQPPDGTAVIPLQGFMVPFVVSARWRRDDGSPLTANIVNALADAIAHLPDARHFATGGQRHADDEVLPPALELRHVRALLAAADKSLRAAATELGLTESGVSRQIATLERTVGATLTQNTGNRLVLTPAGETWCAESAEAIRILDDVMRAARRGQLARSACTIGAVPPELAGDLLVSVLRDLGSREPPVVPEIRELLTPTQVAALRAMEIDIGLSGPFPSLDEAPEVAWTRVASYVVDAALLAESHPLAKREWLDASDLRDLPFVFVSHEAHPRFYEAAMLALRDVGLSPRVHHAVGGPRLVWRMVADTGGWSLWSRMRAHPPAGLVAIPVRGLMLPSPIHLLWRRDEADPDVLAVIDAFRAQQLSDDAQPSSMS